MRLAGVGLAILLALPAAAPAQEPPPDASDLVNVLLAGFLGFRDMTGPELQKEVAELGGVPFRSDVPVEFMDRRELPRYLKEARRFGVPGRARLGGCEDARRLRPSQPGRRPA